MRKATIYLIGLLALNLLFFAVANAIAGSYIELFPKENESRLFGPIEVITCTDGQLVGTDCGDQFSMFGSIIEIASGTVTLPPVSQGKWACAKSTTAAAIHLNPNDADRWKIDGIAYSDGDKASSPGLIDDTICFYGDSTDGWTSVHNPDSFFDGN